MPVLSDDPRKQHTGAIQRFARGTIDKAAAIIINPAAGSFTSIALLDALKMFPGPIIEVHISNIHKREAHYHHSYVSLVATAVIAGLGADGYAAATKAAQRLLVS